MSRPIFIAGSRGVGKTTTANIISNLLECVEGSQKKREHINFADALKLELATYIYELHRYYHVVDPGGLTWHHKAIESMPGLDTTLLQFTYGKSIDDMVWEMNMSSVKEVYRRFMQWYGTDYRRKQFSDSWWTDKFVEAVAKVNNRTITSDMRFSNEYEVGESLKGIFVLVRSDLEQSNPEHESEDLSIWKDRHFDLTIINTRIPGDTTFTKLTRTIFDNLSIFTDTRL